MESTLDYAKLWKTLLRTGIKERFSTLRAEFFMNIARIGPKTYSGKAALDKIVSESHAVELYPDLEKYIRAGVKEDDTFKYYPYQSSDGDLIISYFANLSREMSPELIKILGGNDKDIDGVCFSVGLEYKKPIMEPDEETAENMDEITEQPRGWLTIHYIMVSEKSDTINPDTYPGIIKHELTHACIYETRLMFHKGYFDTFRIPGTWTDEDILNWKSDLEELCTVLDNKDNKEEYQMFIEFISDFLMFESDGQTKVKNPIVESRVPKATKPDSKSRVTYRTLTPADRFEEHLGVYDETYEEWFQLFLDRIKPLYDEYDKFLDDIKM